jgi:hypothetical protein
MIRDREDKLVMRVLITAGQIIGAGIPLKTCPGMNRMR